MAKPKFTPDPVPDGMDPQLAEYLSRQLNRIEDWWPKDYEERIQALEQLAPYCTGTWPIVDYSYVQFGYELVSGLDICDYTKPAWNDPDSTRLAPADGSMRSGVSVDKDMAYMICGGQPLEEVYVFSNNFDGTWDRETGLEPSPPGGEDDSWGFTLSHSDTAGVLAIGAPRADEGGTNRGRVFVYTGSIAAGWSLSQTITGSVNNALFGEGVDISEDGEVLVIGAPTEGTGKVYIYDKSGSTYVYRSSITQAESGVQSFGKGLHLSQNASVLVVGAPESGVNTDGWVYVYDESGATYTQRQKLEKEVSVPGGGVGGGAAAAYFGQGIAMTTNKNSLVVMSPWWDNGGNGSLFHFYELNPSTGDYDYCDYFFYASSIVADPQAECDLVEFGDDIYLLFNASGSGAITERIESFKFTP